MSTIADNIKVKQARNLSLDGLRGVAALLVVLSHIYPQIHKNFLGELGVGIFFVLSGFLMSHLHINLAINPINLKKYAINRFSRIAPIYWLVILFSIVAYHFDKTFVNQIDGIVQIVRHFLFVGSAGVFWSISPEIQFYLFFAGLWISLQSYLNGKKIYFIFFLAVIFFFVFTRDSWPGIALPSKIDLFILGVSAGYITSKFESTWGSAFWSISELLIILLIGLRLTQIVSIEMFYHDLYIAFLVFLLVLAISVSKGYLSSLIKLKIFTFMGKVSFSIYLIHMIVIFYFEKLNICLFCEQDTLGKLVLVFISIIIPALISIYIELPVSAYVRQKLNKRFL